MWVTFVDKDGSELKIAAKEGDNLLDLAQANDIDLEGKTREMDGVDYLLVEHRAERQRGMLK